MRKSRQIKKIEDGSGFVWSRSGFAGDDAGACVSPRAPLWFKPIFRASATGRHASR